MTRDTFRYRRLIPAFALALMCCHDAAAGVIGLFSSGDNTQDAAMVSVLKTGGHTVTLAPEYHTFDGSTDLTGFSAVILQTNFNWAAGNMPVAGQTALLDYVQDGGGLVTTEWLAWKVAVSGGAPEFAVLAPALPMESTGGYDSAPQVTYDRLTPDALLNAGLPDQFTFAAHAISGSESQIQVKPGATVFYGSSFVDGEGVIGWHYGAGRVLSLSTLAGYESLADANYARLISNAADWAGFSGGTAVPEPSTAVALGLCGLAWFRRRTFRRRDDHSLTRSGTGHPQEFSHIIAD